MAKGKIGPAGFFTNQFLIERIKKKKNFRTVHNRFFDWGKGKPRITCNEAIRIFRKERFLWICNYILFTKLPWPGDSEGTLMFSSQAATCPHVYHRLWRLHTVPLTAEHLNTNFYSLWFDPTGNRTRVYRFCSRRFIHLTTYGTKLP